jgi:hypothetical protein
MPTPDIYGGINKTTPGGVAPMIQILCEKWPNQEATFILLIHEQSWRAVPSRVRLGADSNGGFTFPGGSYPLEDGVFKATLRKEDLHYLRSAQDNIFEVLPNQTSRTFPVRETAAAIDGPNSCL